MKKFMKQLLSIVKEGKLTKNKYLLFLIDSDFKCF
jgi:hypothetical protein